MIYISLVFVVVVAAGVIALCAFLAGKNKGESDRANGDIDAIKKAAKARDKLRSDSDYSKRLRDRFKR